MMRSMAEVIMQAVKVGALVVSLASGASAHEIIERSDPRFRVAVNPGQGRNADTEESRTQRVEPLFAELKQQIAAGSYASACSRYLLAVSALEKRAPQPTAGSLVQVASLENARKAGVACQSATRLLSTRGASRFSTEVALGELFAKARAAAGACYLSFFQSLATGDNVLLVEGQFAACGQPSSGHRSLVSTYIDRSLQKQTSYVQTALTYSELLVSIEAVAIQNVLASALTAANRELAVRSIAAKSRAFDYCPRDLASARRQRCVEQLPALCDSVIRADGYSEDKLNACLQKNASGF
jgi:hypothetical protein